MNDTLNGITNDIVKTNLFFNRLRENAYDDYKRSNYNESKLDEIMHYIRNTFIVQGNIDQDFKELQSIVWRINQSIDNINDFD